MSRHTIAAAAAILALAACSTPAQPAPATSAPAATTTSAASGEPHRVTYTLFGAATRLTYLGQAGNPITKNGPGLGTLYTATLLGGDTAKIEAYGDNSSTGLGCSISVDNEQVTKQTSFDATTGVTCTYTVR